MPRAVIEIDEYGVKLELTDPNTGITTSKLTSIDSVREVLVENTELRTGMLPTGTKMFIKRDTREYLVIERPPLVTRVRWDNPEDRANPHEYHIPTPWTLWFVEVMNTGMERKHVWSHVYAMKGNLISSDTLLFKAPWSNVSQSICWGVVQMPIWSSGPDGLAGLSSFPDFFFNMAFNSDLDVGRYQPFEINHEDGNFTINSTQSLFKYLDGKEEFPTEILLSLDTFGSALNYFLGGNRETW